MEKWDLYDRDGVSLGRTINRGARFRSGEHHLVTHVWVVNSAGRKVGGQAVLGRQSWSATPWHTERHGYDPTCFFGPYDQSRCSLSLG